MWYQLDKYGNAPHETWAAKCGDVGCLVMVKCLSDDDGAHHTVTTTFVPAMTVKTKDDGDSYLEQLPGFGQVETLED